MILFARSKFDAWDMWKVLRKVIIFLCNLLGTE